MALRPLTGVKIITLALVLCGWVLPVQSQLSSSVSNIKQLQVQLNTSGFATKSHVDVIPQVRHQEDDDISLNGQPEHLRIWFDEKVDYDNSYGKRHLAIYPVQQYAALFSGTTRVEFNQLLSRLKNIIASKSVRGIDELPIMPPTDAREEFHNQVKYLRFKQGAGISFISAYSNGDAPINNKSLFYTFQGLSQDGKYWLSFFAPVCAQQLPAFESNEKTEKFLAGSAPTKFTPNLNLLNSVVQSISLH